MSMYDDDDFFLEASEFDAQIKQFKESLMASVKEEFTEEMKRLKAENAELQTVKQNFKALQQEYQAKHRQLEYDRKELERTVRNKRLSEMLQDFRLIMYQADVEWGALPKCGQCDDRRHVKYTTPLGRQASEDCWCAAKTKTWKPREGMAYQIILGSTTGALRARYKMKQYSGTEYLDLDARFAETIFSESMPYEGLKTCDTFFKTAEACQAYCDWLNAKETTKG